MIGDCIQGSLFDMTADLYRQSANVQSPSGSIQRGWTLLKTIKCEARPLSKLRGKQTGTGLNFGNELVSYDYVHIKTNTPAVAGDRVTNIKDITGNVAFFEYDQKGNQIAATVFTVEGVQPTFDMFNNISYYELYVNRSEVQSFV